MSAFVCWPLPICNFVFAIRYETWFYWTGTDQYFEYVIDKFTNVPFPAHLKGHSTHPVRATSMLPSFGASRARISPMGSMFHLTCGRSLFGSKKAKSRQSPLLVDEVGQFKSNALVPSHFLFCLFFTCQFHHTLLVYHILLLQQIDCANGSLPAESLHPDPPMIAFCR